MSAAMILLIQSETRCSLVTGDVPQKMQPEGLIGVIYSMAKRTQRTPKGEEIPIEGRIAAVADVFDALTTRRVYRKAMSIDQAVEVMKRERGGQLEPGLVDLFLQSLDEALAIQQQYLD